MLYTEWKFNTVVTLECEIYFFLYVDPICILGPLLSLSFESEMSIMLLWVADTCSYQKKKKKNEVQRPQVVSTDPNQQIGSQIMSEAERLMKGLKLPVAFSIMKKWL